MVALVLVLALAYAAYSYVKTPTNYGASVVLVVRQITSADETGAAPPSTLAPSATSVYTYDSYYRYFASEYLVDDFDEIVKGRTFANVVSETLASALQNGDPRYQQGYTLDGDHIYSTIGASRIHRIMTLVATTNEPQQSLNLALAAADTLVQKGGSFLGAGVHDDVGFQLIDYPKGLDDVKNDRSKKLTSAVIIVLLGFIIGLALAFLLEYLDDRVRDVGDAQRVTDLPVIGRVPTKGTLP